MKGKGKLYSVALALTIFFFLCSILSSTVALAALATKIGNGTDPAVHGNKVVWTDNGVIHVYDLTARKGTAVNSSAASHPAIYGNKIVWHDKSSGTPRLAVYDIPTATKTYITQNVDQYSKPAIYGDRIVWSADYNETSYNYNVYMWDISTSTLTKIAEGNDPDIYETKIAYGYDDDYGRNIVVYDVNTKETINVHHSSQVSNPHIYGNKVIWSDFHSRDGYIQMYDLDTKKIIDVTSDTTGNTLYPDIITDAGADTGTHPNIHGDKIVYSKSGNDQFGYAGVYVYDIPSAKSTPIDIYPEGTHTTPDVYGNIVVWGFDSAFGSGISITDIYLCDLTTEFEIPEATSTANVTFFEIPEATFTANVTFGAAPLDVLFTATGIDIESASWLWDFGDGTNSERAMDVTHTFTNPGTYDITLKVAGEAGNVSIEKRGYIRVTDSVIPDSGIPIANFSSNVTKGYAPLAVQFSDTSQNAVSRAWDFNNDGIPDSSDPNPVYVYTSPGTYLVNLTIYNANGLSSMGTTITVLESSSSSDSNSNSDGNSGGSKKSGGSNRGGGGGGGGSPEPAKNVEVKELSQAYVKSGKPVKFEFAKNATCVMYVSFDAKKTLGKTTTIAEQLKGKSALVSELPSGEVYKSFNTWIGSGGVATSKNIENQTVCFKVEKAWIQDKKIYPDSITLNGYVEKEWKQLPVEPSGKDDKFLYFTAKAPGVSSFAITGNAERASEEVVTETQLDMDDENVNKNYTLNNESKTEQKGIPSIPGFAVSLGIFCILGLFLYIRK
ncbi:MAG: PGF-pre-PGF domain-containing protein [Methanosarcina flavescens]